MEAVGLAASLLTLAATALQTSRVISELVKNFEDCPKDLANLTTAVQQLEKLVAYIRSIDDVRLDGSTFSDSSLGDDLKNFVNKCTQDLSDLQPRLSNLGPATNRTRRARVKIAIQRMTHSGELDTMWKQILHNTQLLATFLTRIGINDNCLNLTKGFTSVENTILRSFDQLDPKVDKILSFAASLPSLQTDIRLQQPILDRLAANQEVGCTAIGDIHQLLSQNLVHFNQYQQSSSSEFMVLQSKMDDVRSDLVHISETSRQDSSVSNDILAAIRKLQLDMDNLKSGRPNGEVAMSKSPAQETAQPLPESHNDAPFEASFRRLLHLSENSLNATCSRNLKATIKDLVTVLDRMKTWIEADMTNQRPPVPVQGRCCSDDLERIMSISQLTEHLEMPKNRGGAYRYPSSHQTEATNNHERFQNVWQEEPILVSRLTDESAPQSDLNEMCSDAVRTTHAGSTLRNRRICKSFKPNATKRLVAARSLKQLTKRARNSRLTTTKVTSFETTLGRCSLLVKLAQSIVSQDDVSEGRTWDDHFYARLSLLPAADSVGRAQVVFEFEQLQSLQGSLLRPTKLSFKAMRSRDCIAFDIAARGSPVEMARLFADQAATVTDCDEDGSSLLGCALDHGNVEMVKYLVTCGADVDSFESSQLLSGGPNELCYYPVAILAIENCCECSEQDIRSSYDCLEIVVQSGADITAEDDSGCSPVESLLCAGSVPHLKAMIDHGYPLVAPNFIIGSERTPLQLLLSFFVRTSREDLADVFQIPSKVALLLSRGADPTLHDRFGNSLIQRTLLSGKRSSTFDGLVTADFNEELKDILMLLITAGADVLAVNDGGHCASDIAVRYGNRSEWEEALQECGYDLKEVLKCRHRENEGQSTAIDFTTSAVNHSLLTLSEYLEIRKSRQLHLEVAPEENYKEAYERYYNSVVPDEYRTMDLQDDSVWETEDDEEYEEYEDDVDDELDSGVESETPETGIQLPKEKYE